VLAYLDASALTKLAIDEPESTALRRFVRSSVSRAAASVVAEIETRRAVRRAGGPHRHRDRLEQVLFGVEAIELDDAIRRRAALVEPFELRTLDAIHLASALSLGDELESFVCYDARLSAAAELNGLPLLAPGR
jgi:predicted nucleic acid-binding protein